MLLGIQICVGLFVRVSGGEFGNFSKQSVYSAENWERSQIHLEPEKKH